MVVGEDERNGRRLQAEADRGDRLVEPGPAAADLRGLGEHRVDIGAATDARERDRGHSEPRAKDQPTLGQRAVAGGQGSASLVRRQAGEIHPGRGDAGQDPSGQALVERDETADDRGHAEHDGEDEGDELPTRVRDPHAASWFQDLLGDGQRPASSR